MSRRVKDDRYFLSEIHRHSEKISNELKRLKNQTNELKSSAQVKIGLVGRLQLLETEKTDLEQTSQKLRFILTVLNNVSRRDNVQIEIQEKINENKDLLIRLEDVYVSRKNKERNLDAVKKSIEHEKKMVEQELLTLSSQDQQEYHMAMQQLSQMKQEIAAREVVLRELGSKSEFYRNKIDLPVKKSLLNLTYDCETLKEEREDIIQFLRSKGSVEQEEDKLLQAIRDARYQLQKLESENKAIQIQLDSTQEVIDGLDKDLQEGYSARHGKYLELMKREQKMNQFIDTASDRIQSTREMLNSSGNVVAEGLNYWALHLGDTEEGDFQADNIDSAKQEYQMQSNRLETLNERMASIKSEISELRNKKFDLEKQLLELEDPDEARDTLQTSIQECHTEKEVLVKKTVATDSAIETAFKSNKTLTEQLSKNKAYGDIKYLEEKITDLENRRSECFGRITMLTDTANTVKEIQEANYLVHAYNTMLKSKS